MKIVTELMGLKYGPVTGLRKGYQNLLESISDLLLASRGLYFMNIVRI
jgi:hypothetical protein